jgi:hypothetical protein
MSFGRLRPLSHVAALVGVLAVLGSVSVASADTFDTPLKTKVVDFGLSSSNPPGGRSFRVKLSCWSYPTFMVKEYNDEGEKGARWLAIVPVGKGAVPACTRAHALGEKIIKWPEWSGYFDGVKGNLVFFRADDGTDGGLPFVVYDFNTGITDLRRFGLRFKNVGSESRGLDLRPPAGPRRS